MGTELNIAQCKKSQRLNVTLPLSLHRRFKTVCSARGNSMLAEAVKLIKEFVEEAEAEPTHTWVTEVLDCRVGGVRSKTR